MSQASDYKAKYYETRRAAKELIFENHAMQNEIKECRQKICQRERERELLLQHLLQYEQEEWELQREMANASTEKHKTLKKQQDADKRKRLKAEHISALDHSNHALHEDANGPKIPKIKIVFQQKVMSQDQQRTAPAMDINSEAKMAIKNKLKRNKAISKLEPIVISLPTAVLQHQDKDAALQQLIKKHRPNTMTLPLSISQSLENYVTPGNVMTSAGLMASSSGYNMLTSPSILLPASSHLILSSSSASSLGLSPGFTPPTADPSENLSHTSDNTPFDVFSESENSCNVSPSNSGSDVSHNLDNVKSGDYKNMMNFDDHSNPMINLASESFEQHVPSDPHIVNPYGAIRKMPEGFKISSSVLRSIKQKIDNINAKSRTFDLGQLKCAPKNINLFSPPSSSKTLDKRQESDHDKCRNLKQP